MNIAVACFVFFLAATQALAEEREWTEGSNWPSSVQADLEEPTYNKYLLRNARNRNPEKFYGLPGKRNTGYRAGNFIGLMGKRSLSSDSAERNTDMDFYRRRK